MGGKQKVSKPSHAELALQNEQTELLRQQRAMIEEQNRQQNLLSPFLYKAAGIKPVYEPFDRGTGEQHLRDLYARRDAEGPSDEIDAAIRAQEARLEAGPQLTGFEEIPGEQVDPEAAEIEQRLQERTLAGLKGELPLDPALMNELETQERNLRQSLEKTFGPGYETSTPAIQALAEFNKQKAGLISQAQRGDITLGEQLGLAREAANQGRVGDFIGRTAGISGLGSQTIGGLFGVSQGYSGLLQQMQQNRLANLAGASSKSNVGASVGMGALSGAASGAAAGGGWGALIGGVAGAAMGGLSSQGGSSGGGGSVGGFGKLFGSS